VRVAGCWFVTTSKQGVGAISEFLADAMPVNFDSSAKPPEIELTWAEESWAMEYFRTVVTLPIPGNVVWKQKTKDGEVQVVRPVEKPAKALKGPRQKALPARKQPALRAPNPQLALL